MHITSSVFINDDESGLHHGYDLWLENQGIRSVKDMLEKLLKERCLISGTIN